MAIPKVTQTIQDNSTGRVPEDTSAVTVVVGTCSSGTAETVYGPYEGADAIDDLVEQLVSSPAVKAAAFHLSQNGSAVYVVPVDTTGGTAAALSAVTATATGSATVAVSGTPKDDYEWKMVIITGGEFAVSTAKFSFDGGQTYRAPITLSASVTTYATETGITFGITAGSGDDFVAGDYYTGTSTAAVATAANYGDCIDAAVAEDFTFGVLHLVGMPAGASDANKASAAASRVATAQTKAAAAETSYCYISVFNDSANVTNNASGDTDLVSAFASTEANRCFQGAGFLDTLDPIDETWQKRPVTWAAVSRARQIAISEDPAFVGAIQGSLGSAVRIVRDINGTKTLYLDSRRRSTLHNARFLTARTHKKLLGAYICGSLSMAPVNSDFEKLPNRRVIDRASELTYAILVPKLNSTLRVNSTTGRILEEDAQSIETYANALLRAGLSGQCSGVTLIVNRTDNLVSSPVLRVRTLVVPFGYAEQIENTISFLNPALSLVSVA